MPRLSVAISMLLILVGGGTALARQATPSALIAAMEDSSPKVRAKAARAMGGFPDAPEVVFALIDALSDESQIVRGSAARSLELMAPESAFDVLCDSAMDSDDFVAKWAVRALKAVVMAAKRIVLGINGLSAGKESDAMTKAFQGGFLEKILESERFDVAGAFDFGDSETGEKHGVKLEMVGELIAGGTRENGTATSEAKTEAPCGAVVFDLGVKSQSGQGVAPPTDPYADEYSIRVEPEDARVLAAGLLGQELASALRMALDSGAKKISKEGQNGRKWQ